MTEKDFDASINRPIINTRSLPTQAAARSQGVETFHSEPEAAAPPEIEQALLRHAPTSEGELYGKDGREWPSAEERIALLEAGKKLAFIAYEDAERYNARLQNGIKAAQLSFDAGTEFHDRPLLPPNAGRLHLGHEFGTTQNSFIPDPGVIRRWRRYVIVATYIIACSLGGSIGFILWALMHYALLP